MFQSLLNTRHCSSKPLPSIYVPIKVSILTQYKALFIPQQSLLGSISGRTVSILTQYKALFILRKDWEVVKDIMFQSLLNTRHCSS